jgi:L-alanine-DL-glutamate epimerase-like enolase superfamily enzyme
LDRAKLQQLLPAGAARNAVDCALWDLEAKRTGRRIWELIERRPVPQVETAFTISLDTPEAMASSANSVSDLPILKLKLGGDDQDLARVEGVRANAPKARLLVDANESWSVPQYEKMAARLANLKVELIEQPFPAGKDDVLESLDRPIPVCADESCHTSADLPRLRGRYDVINLKLDKTGGLTEALRLFEAARQNRFKLLIGCMVSTSLAIAPARTLAGSADWVDLDGAMLLARDRDFGLECVCGQLSLPSRNLWG